jgi:hypothetical protein
MIFPGDARVPVVFASLDAAGEEDGLLIEGDAAAPAGRAVARFSANARPFHPPNCACCRPRAAAAAALGRLFQARARGEVAFFRRVVAVVADEATVREALTGDTLTAAWFRLG